MIKLSLRELAKLLMIVKTFKELLLQVVQLLLVFQFQIVSHSILVVFITIQLVQVTSQHQFMLLLLLVGVLTMMKTVKKLHIILYKTVGAHNGVNKVLFIFKWTVTFVVLKQMSHLQNSKKETDLFQSLNIFLNIIFFTFFFLLI